MPRGQESKNRDIARPAPGVMGWLLTLYCDVLNYLLNRLVAFVPSHAFRNWFLKRFYRWKIGKNSSIHGGFTVEGVPNGKYGVTIGDNTVIGREMYLAGVGWCDDIIIGNNVNIAMQVLIATGSHDLDLDGDFGVIHGPVIIEDHAVVFARAIIVSCRIGRGAVVLPGSVVNSDVEPFTVVGGVPARVVKMRGPAKDPEYRLNWRWRVH